MKLSIVFLILFGVLPSYSQVQEALVSGRYSSARQIASDKPAGDDLTVKMKPAKKSKKSKVAPVVSELPTEKVIVDDVPNTPPKPIEKITAEDTKVPAVVDTKALPAVSQLPPAPVQTPAPAVVDSNFQLIPYQEQVHADDVRNNSVEVDVIPFYFWLDSKSRYSYRNYKTNSLGLNLGIRSNLQDGLIVEANYSGSFASDIDAGDSTLNNVPLKMETLELGLKKINYFGLSRKAMSVSYGASFFDNSTKVSAGEDTRTSLKTTGLKLGVDLKIPSTPHYTHVVNLIFAPKLAHKEVSTDLKLKSGTSKENYIIGLKCGGEIKMNRENQMLWSLDFEVEKNLFSGSANRNDPKNGLKPENVSVTQTKTIFSFGYRWGE